MMSPLGGDWCKENSSRFSGQLSFDEPLSKHTYYRIGGPASVYAVPKSIDDLNWLAEAIRNTGIPFFIMGAGSNLLVSDSGFKGLIIRTHKLNQEMFALEDVIPRVRTGGSVMISSFLRRATLEGWGGLEFLTGIPGTVGGVVRMNGGTHLGEAKDRLRSVEAFSLLGASAGEGYEPQIYRGQQLQFEYRKNLFLPEGAIVWAAEWEVVAQDPEDVKTLIDETLIRRKSTQPLDFPSCGSVFKNPKASGISAWQVIDKLGLRGHRIGDAQFSEKHSNFILNLGAARASDVSGLIKLAKNRASKELGVTLEEEVIYIG